MLRKWQEFVNVSNWTATQNLVICIKHFEEKFLLRGDKCTELSGKINSIPLIPTNEALNRPSTLQNPSMPGKATKSRVFQDDELTIFNKTGNITLFHDLTENRSFTYHAHTTNQIMLY